MNRKRFRNQNETGYQYWDLQTAAASLLIINFLHPSTTEHVCTPCSTVEISSDCEIYPIYPEFDIYEVISIVLYYWD